jgi:hypothetical protein
LQGNAAHIKIPTGGEKALNYHLNLAGGFGIADSGMLSALKIGQVGYRSRVRHYHKGRCREEIKA